MLRLLLDDATYYLLDGATYYLLLTTYEPII